MTLLYRRQWVIRAGQPGQPGREWRSSDSGRDLAIEFEIQKKGRASSNKATLRMTNLNKDSIGLFEQDGTVITITAGYVGRVSLLFSGDVSRRGVTTKRQGADRVTEITAGNAELALQRTRSDIGYDAGVTRRTLVEEMARRMGVGVGNLSEVEGIEYAYPAGFAHAGLARDVIAEIAADTGVRWSIQNGVLQFLRPDQTTREQGVLLTPRTGLIGIPERQKGGVKGVSLLNGDITPGRPLRIESEEITGFYKVTELTHRGGSRTEQWQTDFGGKFLGE